MSKADFVLQYRKVELKRQLRRFLAGLEHPDAKYHARQAAQLEMCRLEGDA